MIFGDVRIDDELARTLTSPFVAVAGVFLTLAVISLGFRFKKRLR